MFKKCLENRVVRRKLGFKCYLCHFETSNNDFKIIESHIEDDNHKQKLHQISAEQRKKEVDALSDLSEVLLKRLADNYVTLAYNSYYLCHMCGYRTIELLCIFEHTRNIAHTNKLKGNYSYYLRELGRAQHAPSNVPFSKMIKVKSTSEKNIKENNFKIDLNGQLNHPVSVKVHVSKITKVLPSKKSIENSDAKGSQVPLSNGSNSQNMDDVLNDLIDLDLKNRDQRNFPSLSKPKQSEKSPTASSRMNKFNKNVLYYGKNFIKYCIEPGRQCIYNIDPEEMDLMKLGASLVIQLRFQLFCITCEQQFAINKQLVFEHLRDSSHIRNLMTMVQDNEKFADYTKQFSDLRLAKCYMSEKSDEKVQCLACNTYINNNDNDIYKHTTMLHHIAISQNCKEASQAFYREISGVFEDLWYYAQVFICEICPRKCNMEIDFVIHLGKSVHLNEVEKLTAQGIPLKFDFCPVCMTCWFGKPEAHKLHCESLFHQRFANNGDFTVPKMSPMTLDLLNNLDAKIGSLINYSDRVNSEKNRELQLLKDIENTVKPEYPRAKAYIFGSRQSNLGLPDSDVDVFLDCQDLYHKSTTQEESKLHLLNVKKYFERNSDMWIIDEILLATRVPIMKMRHISTGLKCDISFTNGIGVEKSTLVGDYNNAYPICRQLILYLKKWLTSCKLAGSECITTFAISWFVIFYLQLKGIVSNVYNLIKLEDKSKLVDGWECGFGRSIPVTSSELTFKEHLKGFFSYYAKFDYRAHVICPFLGILIKKRRFAYPETLPDELEIYKRRLRAEHSLMFRFDSPIAIQDPVDLSQNMTKAVKKLQLRCFRQYCAESYEKI